MRRIGQRRHLPEGAHVRPGDAVEELDELFHTAVTGRARVRCQKPVRLDEYSEPQPDFVVMRPRSGRRGHPSATDVFLVVEISDSTLRYDLDVKVPLYARHAASVPNGGVTAIPGVSNATVDLSGILSG